MFYRINNFLSFEVHKKEQNLSTKFSTLNSELLTRSQSGYDYFGARFYDSDLGRWMTVDPLMDKYPGWSPYNYVMGDPLRWVDPDGMRVTKFIDENGNIEDIEDGSNAVFKMVGKDQHKYYEFVGFELTEKHSQGVVNLTTLVQEGQKLNMENPALEPNPSKGQTYCNFATQNIMRSIISAGIDGALINGRANEMRKKLENSAVYRDLGSNKDMALAYAETGAFVVHSYVNPNPSRSGHVGSFTVGENRVLGEVANIGSKNGFMSISKVYSNGAKLKYFVLKY